MATELSATVSSKGQVVIPADVRRRLGLVQGSVVRFCMDDEGVRLIPAVGDVRRLKGRVPVPPQPVTLDIARCQTTARACALVYSWWSWYCRAAHPTARMEAITSRPLLLAAVGKATSHAGQTTLYLTPMHGKAVLLRTLIANIHAALRHVRQSAEQFASIDPWTALVRYVSERIAPAIAPPKPDSALPATG
jgi:AbrB family looped-hinge helix DNA binding protein